MLELVEVPGQVQRALTEEVHAQASLRDDRLDITAGFFYEKNWSPHYQQSAVLLYGGYLGQAGNAVACTLAGTVAEPGADGSFYCYSGARITLGKSRSTDRAVRSEEHTSELQSLMRISYAVFCLKKKKAHEQIQRRHI